jgi:hypothetical protein
LLHFAAFQTVSCIIALFLAEGATSSRDDGLPIKNGCDLEEAFLILEAECLAQ